jgi:hypothetical protein
MELEKDEEKEKRERRRRSMGRLFAFANGAIQGIRGTNYYILDGSYHNGVVDVPVQMIGSSLEECVGKLKDADPNFGLHEMSFTGGWVSADYGVTAQVRSLV